MCLWSVSGTEVVAVETVPPVVVAPKGPVSLCSYVNLDEGRVEGETRGSGRVFGSGEEKTG